MASSFLAPPLPILSSLRQPQIASLCPSSLNAAPLLPSGSPRCNSCCRCRLRRRCASLPILCSSLNSRAAYASEEERKKKLLESYGLDPSDFLSRSDNELRRRRRRRDQGNEVGKGKHVPLFQESKPPLRTTHKLLQDFKSEGFSRRSSPRFAKLVLGGKARRKKLLSPKGMDVRPMMEVVKGSAFDILQVAGGCPASLRPGSWLDLYSGTGAVGIEAISRGCSEAHFVEMDPWVVSNVLQPNLESTGFSDVSVIHTVRVERFFEQAEQSSDNSRAFDYISVTPPYTEVDYSVLMNQLAKSPLVGEDCFIISDRRFGRTNLVIYGPSWAEKKRKSRKDFLAL